MQRMINAAMRFHMAQLLWFDLVSCVATAKAPNLPYQEWLGLDDLDVSCVMGCQNWALSALGDVASLEIRLQDMDRAVATRTISDITDRIYHGIEGLKNDGKEVREFLLPIIDGELTNISLRLYWYATP